MRHEESCHSKTDLLLQRNKIRRTPQRVPRCFFYSTSEIPALAAGKDGPRQPAA